MNNNRLATWLSRAASTLDRSSPFIRWLNAIGMGFFFIMAVFTFVDVFLRYLFRRPIPGSIEISELMLVIVVFLGIAYTQLHRGHVFMDLITGRLSPTARVVADILTSFLSIGVFGILIWRSYVNIFVFMQHNLDTGVWGIPLAPFAALVPLGCTLLLVVLLRDLLINLVEGLRLHFGARLWLLTLGMPALVVALLVIWMQPTLWEVSLPIVGIIAVVVAFIFFLTGMPIAFVLVITGFVFMAQVRGPEAGLNMAGVVFYRTVANYSFSVIALFILMGYIALHNGLSKDLYYSAYTWFGHVPGGLAVSTIGASTAFAAVIGDNVSSTVALGAVALPEMKRYKYDDRLATGCIASGATIGTMIPPSIGFILYGLLAEQSIGDLFIAGIIPGLLLAIAFTAVIYIHCRLKPDVGPPGERASWRMRIVSFKASWPILALFLLVIGGIYAGIFTPTEGGAIGVCGAFLIVLAMRRLTWQRFISALLDAGKLTAMAFTILAGATMFGYVLAATHLPMILAESAAGLPLPPLAIMGAIMVVYLFLGCIMPNIPMIIITVPIFFPIAMALGFDPIWFGVLVILMMGLAAITPPFGISCFALRGVAKEIPIGTIFMGVLPFVLASVVVIALVLFLPPLATWLPYILK